MARDTPWGTEQPLPLSAPLNTTSVSQDIYDISTGGPAIANNGIQRDGGITELFQESNTLPSTFTTYVTSNGCVVGIDSATGNVSTLSQTLNYSPPLYPSDALLPLDTLFPSGSTGAYVGFGSIGGSGTRSYFKRQQIPAQYLDVVVASGTAVARQTYTLLGLRYVGTDLIAIDEFDYITNTIYNTKTAAAAGMDAGSCARFARANTLTYANCVTNGGFIYSKIVTGVYYIQYNNSGGVVNTSKAVNAGQLADISCYWHAGRLVFTCTSGVTSGCYYNTTVSNYAGWSTLTSASYTASGVMLGDYGPYVLATTNTAMSLGCSTMDAREPAFWVNISAAGAIAAATGWQNGAYTPPAVGSATGGLYSGAASAATFRLESGVVTPYGCSGVYSSGGAAPATSPYGCFHLSVKQANTTDTLKPAAYPQLDVAAGMFVLRSYANNIALIAMNSTSFGDAQDCGNLVNDFAGGSFGFDIMQGNPALGINRNYFFHPFSWRGPTSLTGICVYKLNNGTFVSTYTTAAPVFQEIASGVVTINSASAKAIIDCSYQRILYSYSAYTPSFFMQNSGLTEVTSVMYLKIFNKYSSCIDPGQTYANYSYIAPMATDVSSGKCTPIGWSAWNGQTTAYLGDYYVCTLGSAATIAVTGAHNGGYVFNANVPAGGDATYSGVGIQMLNAVAVQTYNYLGYYLFPSGGGSNLLPWRMAATFLIHGAIYACDGEYIYLVPLTYGTTGVVQGAAVKLVYAIGMSYLCASPEKAYFLSGFDNSVYSFDGGQTLRKLFQFNLKPTVTGGVFSVRDNCLYLATSTTVLSVREETQRYDAQQSINPEPLAITENPLPNFWTSTSFLKSTSKGMYFICGLTYGTWQYTQGTGNLMPLNWQSSYVSPGEWLTMRVGRFCGQIWCSGDIPGTIELSCNYILPDGTTGVDTDMQNMALLSAQGYYRFSWNPPHSNVMAASFGIRHVTLEQKIVLMEAIVYYSPDAEAIPLTEVRV